MRKKVLSLILLCALVFSLSSVESVLGQGEALAYNSNTLGTLSASAPLAVYTFTGAAGDLVTIQVIGIDLDPAVSLNSPTQEQLASNDNDTPDTTDARIALSLPQDGTFTILVSSVSGTDGQFLLRLNGQPAPKMTPITNVPIEVSVVPGTAYSFSADSAQVITLNVTTATVGFGFRATVTDANGNVVAMVMGSDVVGVSLPFPPGSAAYTAEITALDSTMSGQVSIFLGGAPIPVQPLTAFTVTVPEQTEEAAMPEVSTPAPCGVTPGGGAVNVRGEPNTDADIIAHLQPSQVFEVTGKSNGWYQVTVPDVGIGWVSDTVVFETGACGTIPEVEPEQPVATEEVAPPIEATPSFTPTEQPTATYTPTALPTATATATQAQKAPSATSTHTITPTFTPTATRTS